VGSRARESFLTGLVALRDSIDSPLISGGDAVGSFLRRGLTIVSYNLLEAFIGERLEEVASYINGGLSHFSDLPDRIKRAAAQELLGIAQSKVRRIGPDLSDVLAYTTEVGQSLAASGGPLRLSPLMWQWTGSNMAVDDFHRTMRLFHIKNPWDTVRDISIRIGSPMPDPRVTLGGLLRERNLCAHRSSYSVSNLWIRAVPTQLLILALSADIGISVAASRMHAADPVFYQDDGWFSPNRIVLRFVHQRRNAWAEVLEGRQRAIRVNADVVIATRAAMSAALGRSQVVVVQDMARQTIDWAYPDFP